MYKQQQGNEAGIKVRNRAGVQSVPALVRHSGRDHIQISKARVPGTKGH